MQAQDEASVNEPREIEFFSNSAEKDFFALSKKGVPHKRASIAFATQLEERLVWDLIPTIPITHLGDGVIEMKVNGSPAFRCLYTMKVPGKVIVLHTFEKTTEGPDVKNVRLAAKRAKSLK